MPSLSTLLVTDAQQQVVESLSGHETEYGDASKIERSSKGNAALKVIPLMMK